MAKRTPRQSVNALVDRMDKIEQKLLKISKLISITDETSNVFWNNVSSEVRKAYNEARVVFAEWNKSEIPYFYNENIRKQMKKIRHLSVKNIADKNSKELENANYAKQSQGSIVKSSVSDFTTGSLMGEKKYSRLIGMTQKKNVQENRLNKIVAEGEFLGESTFSVQKQIQNELLNDALDGKYILVIDKNGKEINYKLTSYSEMVARTKLTEAQTESTIQVAVNYGTDLVQVSSHNTKTAYDAQFEGKIYSLTGNDPDFPPATDLPPFHPYCIHTISVTFKEGMEANGSLDGLSQFSKGEIDSPPRKKSFVPLKDRELVGSK